VTIAFSERTVVYIQLGAKLLFLPRLHSRSLNFTTYKNNLPVVFMYIEHVSLKTISCYQISIETSDEILKIKHDINRHSVPNMRS
jgi:hypothetical protein